MIAGTLAKLERPLNSRLESWYNGSDLPALNVEQTQTAFDDRAIQSGTAATRVSTTKEEISVGVTPDGEPTTIHTENVETREAVSTEWVADVTGTGIVAAESLANENSAFPFPFDLFMAQTNREVEPIHINVEELSRTWKDDDVLSDVWMVGADAGDGAKINYHNRASRRDTATIGLGFERVWNGSVARGVVYESGYVAVYSIGSASSFIRFVDDELMPFATTEGDDMQQQTLGYEEDG